MEAAPTMVTPPPTTPPPPPPPQGSDSYHHLPTNKSSTLAKLNSSLVLDYKIPFHRYNINNTKFPGMAMSEIGKQAS
jgi:hypothetical protein